VESLVQKSAGVGEIICGDCSSQAIWANRKRKKSEKPESLIILYMFSDSLLRFDAIQATVSSSNHVRFLGGVFYPLCIDVHGSYGTVMI
jgi:hypothetical protein